MAQLPLENLRVMVETANDLTADARAYSERDRDYYDHAQWTAEQIAVLKARKQPIITINRIQRKIDAMVGIEQGGRVDPRAYPRTPADEQAADIATKALVFVDDQTRFDAKRSSAFENLLIEGYGGVEIGVEMKRGKFEVVVNRLRWEELFFDPHSREKDFSDASYIGCQKWMTMDQALDLYAGSFQGEQADLEEILSSTIAGNSGDTYEDRPFHATTSFQWGDKKQRRCRVAQMYYRRGGVWYLAVFTGGGEILNQVSPYQDEDGNPTCPIILMTAYIDRENRRYGVVRSMISMQDEINARRSKLLHALNARQTMGIRGAVSVADVKSELAKPDGHVEIDPFAAEAAAEAGIRPFEIVPQTDQIAGQFSLLTESKSEIDMLGPNASLLGQLSGQQSGRAIMAQQRAGMAELAPIYDSLRDWTLRCYRAMWERMRQFWTEERWIRITDDAQAPQFLSVNVITGIDPYTGQPVMENALAQMDVDIIIDESPDYVTLQHEEFEQLAQMAQSGVPIPPEVLIEASSLRNKQKLIETMQQAQQMQAMQAQGAAQAQQVEAETKAMATQAKAQRDMAGAAKDAATAEQISMETRQAQIIAQLRGF